MKKCPTCGRENKSRAKFCTGCGSSLAEVQASGGGDEDHSERVRVPTGLAATVAPPPEDQLSAVLEASAPQPPGDGATADTDEHLRTLLTGDAATATEQDDEEDEFVSMRTMAVDPSELGATAPGEGLGDDGEEDGAGDAPARLVKGGKGIKIGPTKASRSELRAMAKTAREDKDPELSGTTPDGRSVPARPTPAPRGPAARKLPVGPTADAHAEPAGPVHKVRDVSDASDVADVPDAGVDAGGGKKPGEDLKFKPCPRCGKPVPESFAFCGNCGASLRDYVGTSARVEMPTTEPIRHDTEIPDGEEEVGSLVLLTPDGRDLHRYPLHSGENVLGRSERDIVLTDNVFLSPRHASIRRDGDDVLVADLDSLNGVYRRIREETPLADGDMVCIGQQFLRFEKWDAKPPQPHTDGTTRHGSPIPTQGVALVVVGFGGEELDHLLLRTDVTIIGRANGDVLFPTDSFVSRSHAKFTVTNGACAVADLGSSNGTYLRIKENVVVQDGDVLLFGDQLFRVDLS